MILRTEPLSAHAFAPFGDVIETDGHSPVEINRGSTEKFADLARLTVNGGRPAVHLFRGQPVRLPLALERLERHLLGSQAFIPLHDRPFPLVVAAPGDKRDPVSLRAFMSNGRQGINLWPGTWHHALLCLEQVSDFLVIDRHSETVDCEEWALTKPVMLELGTAP
jgi:ureidoglycolate lyase